MKNILSRNYLIFWLLIGLFSVPALAAPTTLTFTSDAGAPWSDGIAEDGEGGSTNIAGITIQILNITDTSGTNLGSISWKNNGSFLSSGDPAYTALTYDQNAGSKGMSIKSSNGSEFQINSFKYYNWGETSTITNTVVGYRDGAQVASMTFEGYDLSGNFIPITVSLDSSFDNVDEVRLYISAGGYLGNQSATNHSINNIEIDDPVLAVPGAPTGASATTGNGQATVTFTAPSSNGGAAITTYTATASPGGATGTCNGPSACSINVTGLTNGTAYTFTVTATNSAGTGSASTASNSVTPKAPQTITFANPGSQNFGTAPTLTATSDSSLSVTFTSSTTGVCTITSGGALTFVASGTCTINANQAGNGSFLTANQVSQSFNVNAVVPNAPTIGTATPGNTQASVTFAAPGTNGGATITGYTVTASPGGATGTGSSSPITVTGLTNGVAYTFTVTATNSAGTGSASAASNSLVPAASQTITFTNPGAQNFGTTPTLTASSDSSLTVSFTSSTTGVCTITSGGTLSFVTAGTCTINANQAGNSSFLAASQVSQSFTVNAVVPGAPTISTATAGDTQATITFTAPASNGGGAITGYTVTSNPGGITGTGSSSPITVTGLTNGVAYTFIVTATNSAGTGSASAASNSITPAATQTITFNNPGAQNFGTTPTLTATSSSGLTPTFTSSTTSVCTITSGGALTFVTAGTCTINADQAGNGSYLAATQVSRSFTINATLPGAPTIGAATAGNTQATVSFIAPATTGGGTITGYTVTSSPGGITATGSASPITVTGLTNGVAYTFTVKATNSAGTGSASTASNSITPKSSQTITFTAPAAQTVGTPLSVSATSTSGLTVVFTSSTPGVCTVSGVTISFASAGTCTINADQVGDATHLAATTVSRSFTVNAAPNIAPVITQGSSTNITMSEDGAPTAFALTLNATDSNSDPLTWSVAGQPSHGSASVNSTGGVGYIPTANFNGSDGFSVSVSDGQASATITINVTITAVNDAPVIGGVPATRLNQDAVYSFIPVASDVDGDTLTFSITNKPAWASFNTSTGALTGTPTKADVGTSSAIVISVSDGTVIKALPAFAVEVVSTIDPALPVLKVPANLEIDATGLYTSVSLRKLLGIAESTSQSDVNAALDQLAVDSAGKTCCTVIVDGVSADKALLLQPGNHELTWTAKNQAGLSASGKQIVNVRPLVSLSKSQIALRGTNTEFRVILNGPSPVYPFTVSYVIDGATTATSAEYTLVNGSVTFTQGQLEVPVAVPLKQVSGLADSQVVVRLTGDVNIGAANKHSISIREGNIPPVVRLSLTQGGFSSTMVTPSGGPVTVTAVVNDTNVNDTHTFDWSGTSGLADTDGNPANATRVFDASGLSGSYQVQVKVTDSGGATVQAQLYFHAVVVLPTLSDAVDTDRDGIADKVEGSSDSDGNGIPDYLDNMPSSNILPQKIVTTDKYLIECDPGVRCGLGLLAMASSTGGVQILDNEVTTISTLKVDTTFTPVGGIFDFAVSDLPTAGQSVNIVIPQTAPIPANAVYRKFQKGQWINFVENADNVLRSTTGVAGYCPPPGSAEWKPGLIAGNFCVQLTISDGGPNDGDGIVNSMVLDPGAVSVAVVIPPDLPAIEVKAKGKGGAVDLTLLLIIAGGLLLMRRDSKLMLLGSLLLIAIDSHAADFSDKTYLRLDAYTLKGSQGQGEFNSRLMDGGYGFTLNQYDVNRTGFQVSLGYNWNENLYTELGYLDLGTAKVNLSLKANVDQAQFEKDFARYYPASGDGLTLVQGFRFPFAERWSIAPEIGAFVWKEEVDVEGDQFSVKDKSGTDALLGLRLEYQLTDVLGAGIGVRHLLFKDDKVNLWGVSVHYNF